MAYFLVHRMDGRLQSVDVYAYLDQATHAYEDAKTELRALATLGLPPYPVYEAVLLGAETLGELLVTHADWFDCSER